MVWIDYKQISYCVRALIINSMEVLTDNGEIRLKTSQERDSVVVEISDTGPAMPKEIRESLTTPFVDTQELGTGTGLPVCRAILERHGNEFIIEDRPGGGTVYKMKLPIKKGESLNE